MLIASTGGHLAQLAALREHWEDVDVHWVTFRKPDAEAATAGEPITWAHHPTTRNIPNAIRNLFLAIRTLRTERPDVILSDGAGVALPFFVVARVLGIPAVYLEVYDRVSLPTLTGRLCYPLSDAFLVQWPQQRVCYPEATVVGTVY